MPTKEVQINLRVPTELDAWIESRAGGKRAKPAFIRQLLERERAREEEERLVALFNAAWDSLSGEERAEIHAEREDSVGVYPGGSRP